MGGIRVSENKLQEANYSYLVLYKKGITIQDVIDNKDIFLELSNNLYRKNKSVCDINLKFKQGDNTIFEIKSSVKDDKFVFQIDIDNVDFDALSKLLFGQVTCSGFLHINSRLVDNSNSWDKTDFREAIKESIHSWDRFIERVGYKEDDFFTSDESILARKIITEEHILWCYNKSCTGKTFLGLNSLMYCNYMKFAYNPTVNNTCNLNLIKTILEYGTDCALLIDDLQCDVEFARKLLFFICTDKNSIKERNLHIFLTSWSSLLQDKEFSAYSKQLPTIKTKPQMFINMMKDKIDDQTLLDICGNNLALISTALRLKKKNLKREDSKSYAHEMFGYFVQTSDKNQLKIVHILAVLGTYEFETPVSFIKNFGALQLDKITTAKVVGESIFLAHRTVSNFIARYIEKDGNCTLLQRKEIIKRYINYIDNRKKWKALVHLIGENNQTDILSVSPLWNLMYEFQNNLKRQTKIDPSWDNTPSSMYFVISTAEMLGVVDEYKDVIDALCANFSLSEGCTKIRYDLLKTTVDFVKIRERMIEEDKIFSANGYESGESINLIDIHRNWLYGLLIGLKSILVDYGYKDLIKNVEDELIRSQDEGGYWYPKRVPWVTARILIGLAEAGYSIKDECVKNGVKYLTSVVKDSKWEAHTGGWNNVFETSSLCLEALIKCGVDCDRGLPRDVADYLLGSSQIWMSENYEIDGTTTACALLKILGIQDSLLYYINELAGRNIHNIVDSTGQLDYNNTQSCKTTQIAYYVIELCWYILEKDISSLLDDFIARSEQEMEVEELDKGQIFISYSEDGPYHIKKIARIVEYLENEGYTVYFYENAPLGTNIMEFMQKINQCDVTIVIGTKQYKKKSTEIRMGGVFFEACVLSREFMNSNYEKIIPIAFDEFNESFPEPIAINKGKRVKRVDENFLRRLSVELKNKF